MAKTPFRFLFIIVLSVILFSCKKQSSSKKATMQAMVDGSLVICDSIVHLRMGLDGILYGIEGYKKGNTGFIFLFPMASGKGTYQFLTFNANYQNEAFFQYDFNNQFKSTGGSITITDATKGYYKGTFSFPAKSFAGTTRNITNGEFEIEY